MTEHILILGKKTYISTIKTVDKTSHIIYEWLTNTSLSYVVHLTSLATHFPIKSMYDLKNKTEVLNDGFSAEL